MLNVGFRPFAPCAIRLLETGLTPGDERQSTELANSTLTTDCSMLGEILNPL